MPGMAATSHTGHDASTPVPKPGGSPCSQPVSPATCQVMAPCGSAFVATSFASRSVSRAVPAGVRALNELAPDSRTLAPELPPPRA